MGKAEEKVEAEEAGEEEAEEEEEKEPSVDEWLSDCDDAFEELQSFHRLYVSEEKDQVLLRARVAEFATPFFNQLTFIGAEGNLPDMIDCTPYSTGFQFRMAPNGRDVLLVAMQQRLVATDLAAPLYDADTGGALQGHICTFEPVAVTRQPNSISDCSDTTKLGNDDDVQVTQPLSSRAPKPPASFNTV